MQFKKTIDAYVNAISNAIDAKCEIMQLSLITAEKKQILNAFLFEVPDAIAWPVKQRINKKYNL